MTVEHPALIDNISSLSFPMPPDAELALPTIPPVSCLANLAPNSPLAHAFVAGVAPERSGPSELSPQRRRFTRAARRSYVARRTPWGGSLARADTTSAAETEVTGRQPDVEAIRQEIETAAAASRGSMRRSSTAREPLTRGPAVSIWNSNKMLLLSCIFGGPGVGGYCAWGRCWNP